MVGGGAMGDWYRLAEPDGWVHRLCPAGEPLTEECFTRHHLEFDTGAQGIVYKGMGGGAWVAIAGEFVTEGTHPPGSMWAKLPVPSTALGPRCIAGPNDTNTTPFGCEEWEKELVDGPCKPCPGTAGSDCSRCDGCGKPGGMTAVKETVIALRVVT